MSVMETLLLLLRKSLDEKRVSVADLAAHVGCSRQYVYDVAKGKCIPTLEKAEAIAAFLGCQFKLVPAEKSKIPA